MASWEQRVDGYYLALDEDVQDTLEHAYQSGALEVEVDDCVINMESGWMHLKSDGTRTRELHARLIGHGSVAAGEAVIVFRGAGVGNTALQQAITLAGDTLPAVGAVIPGRGEEVPLGRQRGVVQFPYGELCTLLHAETREVLDAAAAQLEVNNNVMLAAELRYLAQQNFLSETGALLYDQTAAKALHLDDILACNHYSMDARHILWNLGNDAAFQILTEAREKGPRRPDKERDFHREKERTREVVLRHGDAILLNIERVAHGVKIKESCADEAAGLLPHRRMCVSIRPVVTASSPNADDYVYDAREQRYVRPTAKEGEKSKRKRPRGS